MDVDEILFWRDGADLGVRTAKRHLASMVRSVEEQRPVGDRRLFVTAAYLDPEDLGVLGSREHVIGIVPARTQWIARIERRDGYVHAAHAEEHTKWATRWGIGARAADAVGEAGA